MSDGISNYCDKGRLASTLTKNYSSCSELANEHIDKSKFIVLPEVFITYVVHYVFLWLKRFLKSYLCAIILQLFFPEQIL